MGGYSQDKTERKLERHILESKKMFQSIIDGITDGVVLIDREYKIVAVNEFIRQRTEKDFNEILGKHCWEILNCALHGSGCPTRKTFEKGEVFEVIHRNLSNEGDEVYYSVRAFPLKEESGNVSQVVEYIKDISEGERLKKETIRIEKLTSTAEIAAGVAHEVRNPLSIVSASAQYLHKALGPNHPCREFTEAIIKNAHTLEAIVSELLNFTRPLPITLELKDVHECLDKTLKFLEKKFFEQGVQLIKEYQAGLPPLMLDERHMGQVFLNLALNALQAVNQDPKKLTVSTEYYPEKRQIIVKFKDTGSGIPEENMVKIFAPFFSTRSKGIGLGLSMSQKIVEIHGGSLTAESTVGHGATFIITLPTRERAKTVL
ncbi:MAG: ATP-binding protein [Thermodesulfovibrionales bacterium]|nr:ATP-binding protein [Thermodesulfovibrionales bacterium]